MKLAAIKITIDTDEDLTDKEFEELLDKIEELLENHIDIIKMVLKERFPSLKVEVA